MELMSSQISDRVEFWNRARCFNWTESDSYRLLVMDFRDRKALQDEDRIALSMKKHLAMLFPGVNIISLRNKLGMLLETLSRRTAARKNSGPSPVPLYCTCSIQSIRSGLVRTLCVKSPWLPVVPSR